MRSLRKVMGPASIGVEEESLLAQELTTASGSLVLNEAVKLYEATHDGAAVRMVATPLNDRLGPLRRHEVDLSVTRLPLNQPTSRSVPCSPNAIRAS